MTNKRMKASVRKEVIIAIALRLAEQSHYLKITRDEIAKHAGCVGTTVQYHFRTMRQLQVDMMRAAVKGEHLRVIAQGLSAGDPRAANASDELRRRALTEVMLRAAAGPVRCRRDVR